MEIVHAAQWFADSAVSIEGAHSGLGDRCGYMPDRGMKINPDKQGISHFVKDICCLREQNTHRPADFRGDGQPRRRHDAYTTKEYTAFMRRLCQENAVGALELIKGYAAQLPDESRMKRRRSNAG